MREKQVVYYMKNAVFAAADALKDGNGCSAAIDALLEGWFSEQNEPAALFADGLAVPVLAASRTRLNDYPADAAVQNGPCFTVCSASGRHAYERGLRDYAVTVAYAEQAEIKAAMVYDPAHAELYHAVKSLGAYMNGISLSASRCKSLTEAYLSIDHGTLRTARGEGLHRLLAQAQNVRSGASFALELCHLAGGRIDAAVGRSQSFIEYAPGLLIAREAGAVMLGADGKTMPPLSGLGERKTLAAAAPGIAREMGALLAALSLQPVM